MKRRTANGFTLLELVLALALTALVATAAIATLNTFADADQKATQRMEQSTGTDRALLMLRTDIGEAVALDFYGDHWVVTRRDGSAVGYAIAVGGTELHRVTGANAAATKGLANAAASAATAAPGYSARGHLKDSDFRAQAVLQGARSITVSDVTRSGVTLGVQVVVTGQDGQSTRCLAMSVPLLETYSKAAAIAADTAAAGASSGTGAGSDAGSGAGSGLSGIVNNLLGGTTTNGKANKNAKVK
jgi:prepilin-type N-terminal cleavage/methylation domain-containing protein